LQKWSFALFCSSDLDLDLDLDLDPIIFIHELDPCPLKMNKQTKDELSISKLSNVIVLQTYTQKDRQRRTDLYRQRNC